MNFLYIYIWPVIYSFYKYLTINLYEKNSLKIARNFLSITHTGVFCILSSLFLLTNKKTLLDILMNHFKSYNIWDSYFIIIHNKNNEFGYLIHHFIAFMGINAIQNSYNKGGYLTLLAITVAEYSNLATPIVYHLHKTLDLKNVNNKKKLLKAKRNQIVWYGLLRGPVLLTIFMLGYKKLTFSYFGAYLFLYFVGLWWLHKQYKGFIRDKLEILSIKNKILTENKKLEAQEKEQ